VWLAPPEYIIVHKLEFFREGGREKHLRDVRGMLAVTDIDRPLLEKEIAERGLEEAWRAVEKRNPAA
jgi:predicted MarR family transcription regulator